MGRPQTEETKRKLSEARINYFLNNPDARKQVSEKLKGNQNKRKQLVLFR